MHGCLDFTGLAPGPGPNPLSAPPFDITVFDHTGSYYEYETGQPISLALARYLAA